MRDKTELAKHYRHRAGEVREIAKGIFDHEERQTLLEIADEYEQWAGDVEPK